MSLKTWKLEFYPKPPSKRMSKKAAIEHSLQKWIGLRKSNLKKHNLEKVSYWIMDNEGNDIGIEADSCALCVKFYDDDLGLEETISECHKCPLFKHLGQPCDANSQEPYHIWRSSGDPAPMIKALKALLEEK